MADYARATTISSLGPLSKQAKAIIDNHLRIVGEEKAGLVECGKFEANADGNIHINGNKNLSTEILAHYENNWLHHDGNGDGFQDAPKSETIQPAEPFGFGSQGDYILHAGLSLLKEDRMSGQTPHAAATNPYRT